MPREQQLVGLAENAKEVIERAFLAECEPLHARREIARVLDEYDTLIRSDDNVFSKVLSIALNASEFDAASELVARQYGGMTRFEFEFGDVWHYEIIRWEVFDSTRSKIVISSQFRNETVSHPYFSYAIQLLGLYCAKVLPEDGRIDINIGDHGYVPGLAFSDGRPDYFLVPDPNFLLHKGYAALRCAFEANDIAWAQREPIAFWRGGTSGYPTDPVVGWRSLPRIRLCDIARDRPDLIDAGISHAVQTATDEQVRAAAYMRPRAPMEAFNKYKYQIDIDGNTNSWPGLFQKLLSGSPVLKIKSREGYRQWYYDRLKPWVNFVPVASDMSDLVDKILWLQTHDDAARQIGVNGKKLADSLDYRGEIERSAPVITAALRYFSGLPEMSLRFGRGQADNRFLAQGWADPVADGVAAVGSVSSIVLPRPIAKSDYDLCLEASPVLAPPTGPTQELGVVVNGALVIREELDARRTVNCTIPADLIGRFDDLAITLLHPRVVALASAASPLDERNASMAFHGMTLAAVPEGAPLKFQPAASQLGEDRSKPKPIYLLTHHGRLVGANEAGDLKQLEPIRRERRKFLDVVNLLDGQPVETGPLAGFRISAREGGVQFEKNGFFLCAEPDGRLAADRTVASGWETFFLVSEDEPRVHWS